MRKVVVAVTLAVFAAAGQTGFAQSVVEKKTRELDSPKKATRSQAISTLGGMGKGARSAAPDLKALVERESDPAVSLQAMQALTQIGAHRQLQGLLQYPALHIRMQAVTGLAVIGPSAKKTMPDLLRLLEDENPVLRCLAAQAIAEIGLETETETRAMIKLLYDSQPEVRPFAALALMNVGAVSVPALEKVLADSEPIEVRVASLQALASQGPQAKAVVPKLIELLKDPDPLVRANSAAALGAIGAVAKDALPALFNSLLDKDLQVQTTAFQAVLIIGQEDRRALSASLKAANAKGRWAVPPMSRNDILGLIKKLSDKDNGTRIGAALALGPIGNDAEPAIPALTRMLKDDNKQVQYAARQALAQLDQKNREAYLQKLRSERAKWLRDAQADLAKVVALNSKEAFKLANPEAFATMKQAKINAGGRLSIAVNNGPQQAYIRQMVQMHMVYSVTGEFPVEADWVREQLMDMGTEAVPAFVDGLNYATQYELGFV